MTRGLGSGSKALQAPKAPSEVSEALVALARHFTFIRHVLGLGRVVQALRRLVRHFGPFKQLVRASSGSGTFGDGPIAIATLWFVTVTFPLPQRAERVFLESIAYISSKMATDTLAQDLSTRFPDIASDTLLIAECVSVCQNYSITPEELQYKWEAHNFRPSATRSEISPRTLESLSTLKAQIQRDRVSKSGVQKAAPRNSLVTSLNRGAFRNRNPAKAAQSPAQVKLEPTADGFGREGIAGPSAVLFKGPSNSAPTRKKRAYRYMHEKPSERGEVLDDRIDEFAERIREQYDLADLGDPSASTTDDIAVVGRIIQDDDAVEESKLADGAISLECSRALGNGARVPLRFDWNLKIRGGAQGSGSAAFFPGAIAAFRGKNGGGGYFQVSEILTLPPLMPSVPPVKADTDSAFSMFIASGPYTPDQDLGFKPWRALIQKIQEAKPTVVLLLGPFIDALHPLIKTGDVDSTPLNLFRTRFVDPLRSYLDSVPGSIVLVVPSVRDLVGVHAVFPQCELPADVARGDPRIHLLPNPAWFTLNDITFAVTSADVLFHIRKGEFVKRGEEVDPILPMSAEDTGTDAMANVCRHFLHQRSFYPVFPVPLELASEVVLDVSHSDGLRLGSGEGGDAPECAPDVLVVPSRFKQFAKTVYATAALNPSFVSKGAYLVLDVAARESGVKARLSPRVMKLE
ncbi:DNA polymerase alpha/epsilon subunit B-domain-containing protein [Mycena haematopus]|nr:DNA polymerase alpha/epsilon subunit B-domain-containing protein [Mycena haematopus]